ncbi:hypothetical protein ABUV06_001420 [Vibrio alginolyticus]
MSFLFRKITRSKWGLENFIASRQVDDIPAEGLTCCIQTKDNTLSVWRSDVNGWDENLDLLATLFASADGPSKSHVVVLREDLLLQKGVNIAETVGLSPAVEQVNRKHRDLAKLNYKDMGTVAFELASILANFEGLDENEIDQCLDYKIFTEGDVKKVVKEAINKGHIDPTKVSERWRKKLKLDQ